MYSIVVWDLGSGEQDEMPLDFEINQVSTLCVDSSFNFLQLFGIKSDGTTVVLKFNQVNMKIKLSLMQSVDAGLNSYLKMNERVLSSALF